MNQLARRHSGLCLLTIDARDDARAALRRSWTRNRVDQRRGRNFFARE